jgi:hypothetical protein
MLFFTFTGSWPDTLLKKDNLSLKSSQESLMDDLLNNILADNNDGDTLVNNRFKLNAQNTKRPGTIYYGDINLFLLRNLNNPKRDILIIEVNFRNLKGRIKGMDG